MIRPTFGSIASGGRPSGGVKRTPVRSAKPVLSTPPAEASMVQARALRAQTAAQSHNVFRPDIFRVSEGYLN